ncbi:hypothetical protein N201_04535 [Helicobacter pylori UM066]|nr:hypothetical protein K751_05100 [Helicobacter pylori UM066]EQK97027.1 hypothetical protein N201_04535 [Helicobacter pylori UM066]
MKGFTALIGLDYNLHEIFAIVFYCQRFSKFKREHSGFFGWVGEAFFSFSLTLLDLLNLFVVKLQW